MLVSTKFLTSSYSMYYHVLDEAIVVVAVIHTSQHPESWKTPQPPSGQG